MYNGTPLLFNDVCNISRPTTTVNEKGQKIETGLESIIEDCRCRLIVTTGQRVIEDALVTVTESTLYLPFGTDIQVNDNITHWDNTYTVTFVNENPGNSFHHCEAKLKEVKKHGSRNL